MLRTGATRARISGIFELPPTAQSLLGDAGIAVEGDDLIIDREILANGKSRAWISSWPLLRHCFAIRRRTSETSTDNMTSSVFSHTKRNWRCWIRSREQGSGRCSRRRFPCVASVRHGTQRTRAVPSRRNCAFSTSGYSSGTRSTAPI